MQARHQNHGFSLLEVLVAFTITSMAIAIIFQIYSKGTTSAILGKEYAQASLIAESKLATLGIVESLDTAYLSGVENDKFHWQINIQDYIEESPGESEAMIQLKEIELEMTWRSRGKERRLKLATLRPAPVI